MIEATDETATQPRSSEDTYPGAIQPWPGPPQRRPHRLDSVPSASKILQGTVRRRITGRISPSSLEWSSPLAGTTARPSQVPEPNRQPCAKCNPAHPPFHLSSGSAPAACPFGHGNRHPCLVTTQNHPCPESGHRLETWLSGQFPVWAAQSLGVPGLPFMSNHGIQSNSQRGGLYSEFRGHPTQPHGNQEGCDRPLPPWQSGGAWGQPASLQRRTFVPCRGWDEPPPLLRRRLHPCPPLPR